MLTWRSIELRALQTASWYYTKVFERTQALNAFGQCKVGRVIRWFGDLLVQEAFRCFLNYRFQLHINVHSSVFQF